jgi:hypothetical protein
MPVTLDATVGGANANSYATVAEGTTYAEHRPYFENWTGATEDEQKQALIRATQLLDVHVQFDGVQASSVQALQLPRTGLKDRNGYGIASNVLPVEAKYATIELANELLGGDVTADADTASMKRVKAGSVEVEYAEGAGAAMPLSDTVWLLVAHLGHRRLGAGTRRLVRA